MYSSRTAVDTCRENCTPRRARANNCSTLPKLDEPGGQPLGPVFESNQSTSATCGSPVLTASREAQVCGRLGPNSTRSPSSYCPTWSPMNRKPRELSVRRQFEFWMVVPLKRDPILQPAVQHAPGGVHRLVDLLEKWLHGAHLPSQHARIVSIVAVLGPHGQALPAQATPIASEILVVSEARSRQLP